MAGSAEKRPRDGAGSPPAEGRRSKRRRWDSDAPPAEPPPPPPAPPAAAAPGPAAAAGDKLPDTSALAKAKAVLAKQKALAEKLKKLKRPKETAPDTTPAPSDAVRRALEVAERARAAASAARAGAERRAASATATTTAPRALLLNDAGEEVDEEGNVLEPVARTGAGVRAVSTFKVNAKSSEEKRKLDKLEAFAALQRETAAEAAAEDATWADPSVIGRRRGRKAEFQVRRPPASAFLSRMSFIASIDVRVSREGDARFRERRQRHRHPFKAPRPPLRGPIDAGTTGCDTDLFGAARRGFGQLTEPRRAASAHVFLFRHANRFFSRTASYTLSRGCSFLVAIFMLAIRKVGRWKADAQMAATPSPERHFVSLGRARRASKRVSRGPPPLPAADEVR